MKKVAIIYVSDRYDDCDNYHLIIQSITDWVEVTTEEHNILINASYKSGYNETFKVIEQPIDQPAFVKKTVAEHLEFARIEEEKHKKEKELRDKKALEKKHKKELKDKESRLALLKQLQEEFKE